MQGKLNPYKKYEVLYMPLKLILYLCGQYTQHFEIGDIIMATKDTVLETMKQAGTPLNAGKIAELSGLDRKEVDKAMKELKAEGAIVSPVRCKWEPAQK